ncbi:MAG TPA: amidohydrolase family protein, partial [Vicinamibacterales bacterium]|nr:amidohydrolase family protein [Vicinamibacterales bacterium]
SRCLVVLLCLASACGGSGGTADLPSADAVTVFRGARLIDGRGAVIAEPGAIVVREGRIEAVGPAADVAVPDGALIVNTIGSTIIPGLVNAHGHVGDTQGLESNPEFYTEENLLRQLHQYARYGVTTVVSLGGDGEAGVRLRDASTGALDRARLHIAGPVITAATPDAARADVDRVAAMKPDFIKIRVDDNLGTTGKMPPDVWQAVIEQAHSHGLRVAAHIFYLDDAKALVRAGVDLLAHSVRDQEVDDELIDLMRARNVCLVPTLTRELSTFVYESEPDFFSDPFFLKGVEASVVESLRDPERRNRTPSSDISYRYKAALEFASINARRLSEAGVGVAFGTDTGPPGRFQGFFEHLELELLAEAGLAPAVVLRMATGGAADCLGLADTGDLAAGRWADFVVLAGDPLADIRASRTIESVWVGGRQVD